MKAEEALQRLKRGNEAFVIEEGTFGNTTRSRRMETAEQGQHPYAVIVACSDSRQIPEAIFLCGIGELFTIRVAGNVVQETELGSIEYACEHLHVQLVVVLGHTQCGAVGAAMAGETHGRVAAITQDIAKAIRGETDPCRASKHNIRMQADRIRNAFAKEVTEGTITVAEALYHINTGQVEWLRVPE